MRGFKQFLLRGNVVDLAVGVVIGAAFAGLVGAIVKDLLTPLVASDREAARFFGNELHTQRKQISLRGFFQCAARVFDCGAVGLFSCGRADESVSWRK